MDIPAIQIPSKKDLWLNLDSDDSIVSWYGVLRNRRNHKTKENASVMQPNKYWRKLFFKLDR